MAEPPRHATPRPARLGYELGGVPSGAWGFVQVQKSRYESTPPSESWPPLNLNLSLRLASPRILASAHISKLPSTVGYLTAGFRTPELRRDEQTAQIYHPGM
jgi:hypothetical protein